jgi:hypothetical protein
MISVLRMRIVENERESYYADTMVLRFSSDNSLFLKDGSLFRKKQKLSSSLES